jgi:hypothetical protein
MMTATHPDHMASIKASPLSEAAFQEAQRRYAGGMAFEDAKQAVLEERVPGIVAEHGEAVADFVIQFVMDVGERAVEPAVRRSYRRRRWQALVEPHVAAGGTPPSTLERTMFDWFGFVPRRLRAAGKRRA